MRHQFDWLIEDTIATLTMRKEDGVVVNSVSAKIEKMKKGIPFRMECWHADQSMVLFINGKRIASLEYDFGPHKRILLSTGSLQSTPIEEAILQEPLKPKMQWRFNGSPLTLTRLQVDHDLYYRESRLPSRATKNPTIKGNEQLVQAGTPAFATHPSKLGVLGNNQFMMAGDNSAYSLDSRLWGNPDEYVAEQIDDTPFVVHRDLLIGKAWSVYWPAPHHLLGFPIIPDFNQIRFIR